MRAGMGDLYAGVFAGIATHEYYGALAPFVLFWVACPLGVRLDKRGRVAAFALSLGLIFAYYGLLATGISLGRKTLALAPWGPWLPDLVCGAAGAWLWRRQLSG